MKKATMLLILTTIFSKILGFIRDLSLSYFYGTSNISDAYLISNTIPIVIFGFIGVGIATGYIPMYSQIEQNSGTSEGNKYTNNLVNILLSISTIIIVICLIFTEQIVKVFASAFVGETLALAVQFTKISLIGIYFSGLIYIFNGFLQLKGNYIVPAIVGLPMNLVIISSIFLSSYTNIVVLAFGSVIAIAIQLILLIPFIYRKGYRYKFIFDFKSKHIKSMAVIALPVIIGMSVNQINVLIDKTLASQIAVGGISALNYANRLNGFVLGVFVISISTILYPVISKMVAEDNISGLKKTVAEAISIIALLVIPATVGAVIFAEPIVRLLFGRGAFNDHAISMTSTALLFYSIGMFGFALTDVLSRTFYALRDTKTPTIIVAASVIINIILNFILSKFLGIGGLALATSIAAIFTTILMFTNLRKKIGPFGIKRIIISSIKILCASLIMGLLAKISFNYLTTSSSQNLSLMMAIAIGAVVYFTIIYFMKIEDVDIIVNIIKRKIKKNTV
ncbi:MAG: murein biosynthesis integral rane protein MurJ [Anaerocolumna sp.]|jgi:putative peptidoglycan lipid II flippase|nr:murein biosynthesis integral rane protein MurJ [Anaerocolumna sp.]